MRTKLKVTSVEKRETDETIKFRALHENQSPDEEDYNFTSFLIRTKDSPQLFGKFQPGEVYYVDFTKAD